ncbi:DUF2285 domain-containing protein [Bradyrhizobium sp. Ghvi]|uniref:DUF2285 domain-containing protein n=1 Tax=Bradyrhizobium sp. Ghvi TaxID=1855319 RepID=UPI001FCDF00A|nr:DUF2285 domain-containing protein [Bradyrhizobium sp. Ghvi]
MDGWQQGNSYPQIAQGLFGSHRIAERAWKTDDFCSRTILLSWCSASCAYAGVRCSTNADADTQRSVMSIEYCDGL